MKVNKKLIILTPIIIAVLVFIGVYFYYYNEDDNSLNVNEKHWIEENVTSLVDVEVMSDYPVYGEQEGVFNNFLSGFGNATGVEFNQISYLKEEKPNTKGYRFRIVKGEEKLTDQDLLINDDVYILVGKEETNFDDVKNISNLSLGVLSSDLADISYYLSGGENLTYKSYDDTTKLFEALDKDEVKMVVVPHIMYLNQVLDSSKKYYINYTLADMTKHVVLTLSDEDTRLNKIMKKYFDTWKDKNFVEVYNDTLFNYYINSKKITDSDTKKLQATTYRYGYVENAPYEIGSKDDLLGICGEYVNRLSRLTGIDFEFKKYDTVEDLIKAVENKEVDMYFNYYDMTNEAYREVNSSFIEDYVVLARSKDSHIVSSFESLKSQDVSMMKETSLFNYFKDNSKANISEYSNYNDMVSKSGNNILVVDKEVYNYYRNSKFKNYEVLYSDSITKDYSFMIINEEELFFDVFSYIVNTNSYYRYRNTALNDIGNSNLIKTNSFGELYIVILILILVPVLFLITLYVLFKRKTVIKKVKKEERRKYTDELTSLKNRSYLNLNMEAWNKSEKYPQAIVMIDLNNVKYVNDNYGHESGDDLIIKAASTLVNTQLENSEIIRTDGNEFLIYLVGYSEKQIETYTKKLNKELKELPYKFGAAVGYSIIKDDMKTIDDAINEATLEMQSNKEDYK